MKKTDYVFETKEPFELKKKYGNIGEVKNSKGELAIIDMTTNEILAEFDHYVRTIYDEKNDLLIEIKEETVKEDNENRYRRAVRIFDITNKKTVCEDWEITYEVSKHFELVVLEDPSTHKYHIFNKSLFRNEKNGFESEQDTVHYLGSINDIDYLNMDGLALEARQKLDKIRPLTIGQAGRISGVNPSDISILILQLKRKASQ